METMINGWVPFVRSSVYQGRTPNEDGDCREELSFYVVCENEQGARFASVYSYSTEDFSRDEAEGRADAFMVKVEAGLHGEPILLSRTSGIASRVATVRRLGRRRMSWRTRLGTLKSRLGFRKRIVFVGMQAWCEEGFNRTGVAWILSLPELSPDSVE
jgi:hypothetical protein